MVYSEGNQFIKILLILIISILSLTAVVYLVIMANQRDNMKADYLSVPVSQNPNKISPEMDTYLIEVLNEELN